MNWWEYPFYFGVVPFLLFPMWAYIVVRMVTSAFVRGVQSAKRRKTEE